MRKRPSIEEIIEKIKALQLEAHLKIEEFGGEPLHRVKDRHKAASRAYWQTRFELLTDLKYFVDPASAPTSTVMSVSPSKNGKPADMKKIMTVVDKARKLKQAVDERRVHTRRLQAAAAEARRTGIPGKVPHDLRVFDIGDIADEICEAVEKLDGEKTK